MQTPRPTWTTASKTASEPVYALRPAGPDDYPFALALYIDGSAMHLKKIGRWDEGRILRRFARAFGLGASHIVRVDGEDAGWMQVIEFAGQLHLRQLHLAAFARNRGVGSHLIEALKTRAASQHKPVTLDVMHGNPAKELYLRLGFRQIRANLDKTRMIWRPERKTAEPKGR